MTTAKPTIPPISALKQAQSPLQNRLELTALLGMTGKLGINTNPLYCLNAARIIVEHALRLKPRGFYDFVTGEGANPRACEVERGFRKSHSGWIVTSARVGDLVFWQDLPKYWGHVGVVVDFNDNGVLEVAQNTTRESKVINQYQGNLRTIALRDMPTPTTIIRLPESLFTR